MPSWPLALPDRPSLAGFTFTAPDTIISSQPDVGPRMTRQRVTDSLSPISLSLPPITLAQRDALVTFYKIDCKGGALTVQWAKLSEHTGGGTGNFLFTAPPQFSPLGRGLWAASLQMERKP